MTAEEKREKKREYNRCWRQANRERVRANYRRWWRKNIMKVRVNNTLWRQANLEEARAASNQRIRLKRIWLDAYKRERGCVDCGTHEGRLEFDHVNPAAKKFTIGDQVGLSRATLLREIKKCQIRCTRCHRARSVRLGHTTSWRKSAA